MASSLVGASCTRSTAADLANFPDPGKDLILPANAGPQTIVLAGGCFWCTEGVYQHIPGVTNVVAGYTGGSKDTANYEAVCEGDTGHAEAIQITYDPTKTSYGHLLKAFFSVAHDPTTLNRQGPDAGTQYRSAIFYANDEQKAVAAAYIEQLDEAKVFDNPIVTTLEPLKAFYPAEQYHQNYVKLHPDKPYIVQNALKKIEKADKFAQKPFTPPTTQPTTEPVGEKK